MHSVRFSEIKAASCPFPNDESSLVDSSYSDDTGSVGNRKFPAVANGRYYSQHPVFDSSGDQIGSMVKGQNKLGYTYGNIYSDRFACFLIAHCPFNAVWGDRSGHNSYLSIVQETGKFFFKKKGLKFEQTEAIKLPAGFVDYPTIYKIMNDGYNLLYATSKGFVFVDLVTKKITSSVAFDLQMPNFGSKGFSLSPKANILAVAFSAEGEDDLLTGKSTYKNIIRLYQLDQGKIVGEQRLSDSSRHDWTVNFGTDGKTLMTYSSKAQHIFELHS